MYVYNTHESEEKDRPVCRSLEVQKKIEHRTKCLIEAIESHEFEQINRELIECEGIDIDTKVRKRAEILHQKLEHELMIENFLKSHQVHDDYKTIRKDVSKINDMLEDATNKNIDID